MFMVIMSCSSMIAALWWLSFGAFVMVFVHRLLVDGLLIVGVY
jgi:hypothetical protein